MNEQNTFMRIYNAKMQGVTAIQNGVIIASIDGFDGEGRWYHFSICKFNPGTKLWEVMKKDRSENFYLKVDFPVTIAGDIELQDEKGQVCLPELLDILIKKEKIYFFLDDSKFRVLAVYSKNCFIVASDADLCDITEGVEDVETFVLDGESLIYAMYIHEGKKV